LKEDSKLALNNRKTRVASRGGQQRVTGVVVNVQSTPPRRLRREIRAMFHNAEKSKTIRPHKVLEMAGYLNYLNAFPKYTGSALLDQYQKVLVSLSKSQKSSSRPSKSAKPRGKK
jgi:hypothetical protein